MNVLGDIIRTVRMDVRRREKINPISLESLNYHPRHSLVDTIQRAPNLPVIAEIKRASPSSGEIKPKANPVDVSVSMLRGGAISLSVLTEPRYFKGDPAFIKEIRNITDAPLLYKDFVLGDYQIYEAAQFGADVVLLIIKILGNKLKKFMMLAEDIGMESLVEVTNENELKRALAMGAKLIGVNNRDLETLAIDLDCTVKLSSLVPEEATLVSESGINSPEDARKMIDSGADAVLVGTSIMNDEDIEGKVRSLVKAR